MGAASRIDQLERLAGQIADPRFAAYLRGDLAALPVRPVAVREKALETLFDAARFELKWQGTAK